jgi:superfamily II DNA or RNA helicase
MSYFSKNAGNLQPVGLGGPYRECQVGAAWATLAHFTSSSEPALISMPTGSGKTALMMMLSFLLKAERVIIVTPSVALRGQTATKFSSVVDLKSAGAYPDTLSGPRVHDHQGQLTSREAWRSLLDYDVIVATPHTTSPGFEDIPGPDAGLFGPETVVFFDEAHHSRARTWQALIEAFSGNRIVLLTATPFRNDNRRLLAKLVYHYPMGRALKSGIYSPITYHAVEVDNAKTKDQELCKTAVRIYRKQRKQHPGARMLIRAEGVAKSAELIELYRKAGLKVEEVNYKQTLQDNKSALDDLRAGSLDGVVCVDQIGEGLDIPSLKIAVLHKPRQSFPATVQFIGRICREASQNIGEPQLIACPDDVRGPLQKLYTQDKSWAVFLPKMIERIIGRIERQSVFHGVVDVETELDLDLEDIQPFFSARIYRNEGAQALDFAGRLDLPEDVVPVFLHEVPDKGMMVLITAVEKTFAWAEDAGLTAPNFDLHVFYRHDASELLFEYTTSDKIAGMTRDCLWGDSVVRIDASTVAKALREPMACQYLMFGLSNLARGLGSVPSYKTYMGTEVEGAVRPSDSRSFTTGHALAKYVTGETRGIGSNQARVWSIKRASLDQFREWCDRVAQCLKKRGDSRLPNVEFLPAPESISSFPKPPMAMYSRWDPNLRISCRIRGVEVDVSRVSFEGIKLARNKKAISGRIQIGGDTDYEEANFTYSLTSPRWRFDPTFSSLKVDDGQETHSRDVADFFDEFPPLIVLEDASSVLNGSRFEPGLKLRSLPSELLDDSRDWDGCDIHVEFKYHDPVHPTKSRFPEAGKRTVQDQLEEWLAAAAKRQTLIVKDHATGEIADFIEIDPADSVVRFYHCKGCSPGKKPGARLDELKALEQALRSVNRIGSNGLIDDLYCRVVGGERPDTRMVKGNPTSLKRVADSFHANEWRFEVTIVNPGIDCKRIVSARNTNTLLVVCQEWLGTANATLRIIGS